jgi:MOSC domain-containing protein YiiM
VKIVSGGQSGVDRAALDAAVALGIGYGGWVPAGGTAEDLPEGGLLERYPGLRETDEPDPRVRTVRNVRDSDALLVLRLATTTSPGTDLTVQEARRLGRPVLEARADDEDGVRSWLATLPPDVELDVAGPRESQDPGVQAAAYRTLLAVLAARAPRTGRIVGIQVAPGRRLPMKAVDQVLVETGKGLVGDRYHGSKHRHVTVQSVEDLATASARLGREIDPLLTRRNVTVSVVVLPTRPGERLRLGDAELEVVRVAAPCRLLDDNLGAGAQEALRHLGGTVFRVLDGAQVRVGDPVSRP